MKRKISLIITAVALVSVMVVAGALAFFTDSAKITNTVSVGGVDITLSETDPEGDQTTDGQTYDIMPGTELFKDPQINNVGENAVWVRANFAVVGTATDNEDLDAAIVDYLETVIGANWTYNTTDGFYYYTETVAAGANTTDLFYCVFNDLLKTNPALENYKFTIDVNAQAVQSDNNGETVSAADWSDFTTVTQ